MQPKEIMKVPADPGLVSVLNQRKVGVCGTVEPRTQFRVGMAPTGSRRTRGTCVEQLDAKPRFLFFDPDTFVEASLVCRCHDPGREVAEVRVHLDP